MLPADLTARLEAAGLPTDLEGMLGALPTVPGGGTVCLREDARHGGWWAENLSVLSFAPTKEEALAEWLLAAKEAQH